MRPLLVMAFLFVWVVVLVTDALAHASAMAWNPTGEKGAKSRSFGFEGVLGPLREEPALVSAGAGAGPEGGDGSSQMHRIEETSGSTGTP